jgi:hypothetical protein
MLVQMKGENMRYLLLIVLLIALILIAGCVNENKNPVIPTQIPTPPLNQIETTIPQTTVLSTPIQTYKNADILLELNTNPAYGFKMDYPSEWTYSKKHVGNEHFKTLVGDHDWNIGYNFSSPDGKSHVFVYFSNLDGSSARSYPIDTWTKMIISAAPGSYCLDGAGNPMDLDYCTHPNIKLYHTVLKNKETVTIFGAFDARKLVFTSYDDKYFGQLTVYLMYSGRMQGYNYTIKGNTLDQLVKVDGPAWDFARGGYHYAIEFYSPADQMNTTSNIFNHMINSFQITST